MKKKLLFVICCVLCAAVLAACQCQHDWVPADCTTAKTCVRCDEVVGQPLGHSWIAATCTSAKRCSACGRTEGTPSAHSWTTATCTERSSCRNCGQTTGTTAEHSWIGAVNRSGIEGRICTVCETMEMFAYDWTPLTDCERQFVSNSDAHKNDLLVGDWDTRAGELPDSIRFCVSNKKNYKNTHYCVYKLNGYYNYLSGLISFCDNSADYATAKIQIYLDNELAFESDTISELSTDESFTLDVRDVQSVRVVCSTTDEPPAYCVLSASVY